MKINIYAATIGCTVLFCGCPKVDAVEIRGTVRSATTGSATIATEGESVPNIGDPVEIFFKLPGTDTEISVGRGKVSAVRGDVIEAKIDQANGTVTKDQLARISSQSPQKRSAIAPPSQMISVPIATTQAEAIAASTPVEQTPPTLLSFDGLELGPLSDEAFSGEGIHFIQDKGRPGVYKMEPNMVETREHVLLVAGDPVTSLLIKLDRPVRRFGIGRIGTAGGASIPTWNMVAYDRGGNIVGSIGEQHGLPAEPKEFWLEGSGIVRIEIKTDNRYGKGTWATWNSLPVSRLLLER